MCNMFITGFQALLGGFPHDAIVDMTGALGEEVRIQEIARDDSLRDKLWKRMMMSNKEEFGPLLSAGILTKTESDFRSKTGLINKHAYSITAVREVQKGKSRFVEMQLEA